MSKEIEYWRKEVENLKSQLQEKNEDLDSLKRSYDFTYESLTHLQDKLDNCPVSGEVVVKLKGNYHTFFKAKISHPDYTEDDQKDCSEGSQAPLENESPDGKESAPRGKGKGYKIYYKNPVTGEIVEVRPLTKYDVLEIKYNAECEENTRLLRRVAAQKSENEVLHRKVKDLCHKLCQARRESDKLAEKLRKAESEAERYDKIVADSDDCALGEVLGIKHEPNDLEPDRMFYFLRITADEAYRIDMGGYANVEIWED